MYLVDSICGLTHVVFANTGNLQGEAFATFRAEQTRVGRFWYRFPVSFPLCPAWDLQSWLLRTILHAKSFESFPFEMPRRENLVRMCLIE